MMLLLRSHATQRVGWGRVRAKSGKARPGKIHHLADGTAREQAGIVVGIIPWDDHRHLFPELAEECGWLDRRNQPGEIEISLCQTVLPMGRRPRLFPARRRLNFAA